MIDAPARRFIVHEAIPGYEPRRFQPNTSTPWPYVPTPDGALADASQVPAYGETKAQEMAYLAELTDGWYAITNATRKIGFGLRFDQNLYTVTSGIGSSLTMWLKAIPGGAAPTPPLWNPGPATPPTA